MGVGYGYALLGLGLGVGLLVIGAAYGIGKLAAAAMEGIARQPEAAGNIRGTAIVLGALIEGFTFFALIVAILLNPAEPMKAMNKEYTDALKANPAAVEKSGH
jgi:F-type H+-transporting ATPase subunit c